MLYTRRSRLPGGIMAAAARAGPLYPGWNGTDLLMLEALGFGGGRGPLSAFCNGLGCG